MDLELTGKVALVVGGSSGIGKEVARQLALEGATVAIAGRTMQKLTAAAAILEKQTGATIAHFQVDTLSDASVDALMADVNRALGSIDILVNCAATAGTAAGRGALQTVSSDAALLELNTKAVGYLRCSRAVAPFMLARGWGRIVNISGLAARSTGSIPGSMRNVAVVALTKNLADELGPKGINVTVVHPGPTRTEGFEALLERMAKAKGTSPEEIERSLASTNLVGKVIDVSEVATVVVFLASPRSVAINGDAIACGGGIPGPIFY